MKFVVDGMLGGLARWLRMLGHDVFYDPKSTDNALLVLAERDGSALLTRDEELHRRASARKIPALLVAGLKEEDRLAEVGRKFSIVLAIDMAMTRCPECGSHLLKVSKAEVVGRVHLASLKVYDEFWQCKESKCRKVYWMGSHWKQIDLTLTRAKQLLDQDR